MDGSRSRHLGGYPGWSPTEPYHQSGHIQYPGTGTNYYGGGGVGPAAPYPHVPHNSPGADAELQQLADSAALCIL